MNNMPAMIILTESRMRHPQTTDHLRVSLTADARTYTVTNTGRARSTQYTVQLAQSANGQHRLGCCTCKDFANYKHHRMACKHIRVAAALHLSRNKAKAVVVRATTARMLSPLAA
jgi:hypothetical protein